MKPMQSFMAMLLALALAACGLMPQSPSTAAAPAKRPRILITNDDGIEAPGIAALARALAPLGEVVVVAPKRDQSGASHSISALRGIPEVKAVVRDGVVFGHAVDGTPTDSVFVALFYLQPGKPFDLLVSGINYGTNVGLAALYSGTVGATVEGALQNIPAIAFSQDAKRKDDYAESAAIAARIVAQALAQKLEPGLFLNVNIPAPPVKGVRVAPMGGNYYILDRFETVGAATDGTTGLKAKLVIAKDFPPDTDTADYAAGYVTIAPLQPDWTARDALRRIARWPLEDVVGAGATPAAAR